MAWPVRRVFRVFWLILCTATLLALPLMAWEFSRNGYNIHYQGWFIGGIFVILSFPISVYEVALHTEHYTRPRLQRHVIRILWMVPIYGVDAWFALRFKSARKYLDPVRECYEAYVIYNFYAYLMAYLEETVGDLEEHLAKKRPMQHLPFIRWVLRPWQMGAEFLFECRKGVLNYVIMRPLCTGIGLITDIFGLYGQGKIDVHKSYMYLAAATNFSQVWALYCLAMMYHKMHEELAPIRPLSKFIVVKAVVFVTFWQSVVLALLVYNGVISNEDWTMDDQHNVAAGIQDFMICIEMFVAAIAHAYAFPPRDYMAPGAPRESFLTNVRHMFDVRDVVDDVTMVVENHAAATSHVSKSAVSAAAHAPGNLLHMITGGEYVIYGSSKRRKQHGPESAHDESRYALLLSSEEQEQQRQEQQRQGATSSSSGATESLAPAGGIDWCPADAAAAGVGAAPPVEAAGPGPGPGPGPSGGFGSLAARLFRTRGSQDELTAPSREWREMSPQRPAMKAPDSLAMQKEAAASQESEGLLTASLLDK